MEGIIKILIVEDQVMLRDSLAKIIGGQKDMRIAGLTGNSGDALELCRKRSVDLVLMDVLTENESSGITACAEIRERLPDTKVIIMTALPEITFIEAAKKAGAQSFVYKNIKSDDLLFAIRNTMAGYSMYPGHEPSGLPFNPSFTEKEIAVIRLVCQGKSRKEIAATAAMSESSVKAIIGDILDKTGFDSIMKFAVYAVANGFIAPNL
jgi:DNA-binding NarL/FixJ family response regulator